MDDTRTFHDTVSLLLQRQLDNRELGEIQVGQNDNIKALASPLRNIIHSIGKRHVHSSKSYHILFLGTL